MAEYSHHLSWLQEVRTALERGPTKDEIPGLMHACDTVLAQNEQSQTALELRSRLQGLLSSSKPQKTGHLAEASPADNDTFSTYLRKIEARFHTCPVDAIVEMETEGSEQSADIRKRAVAGLSEATQQGLSTTMLLVPHEGTPRGIVDFVRQKHASPETLSMSGNAQTVNAELFRLSRTLVRHGSKRIYTEGPPHDVGTMFDYQRDQTILIPGTNLPLFSPEGQELLERDPRLLSLAIAERSKKGLGAFDQIMLHEETMRGVEATASHDQTHLDMAEARDIHVLVSYEELLQRIFSGREQIGIIQHPERAIMVSKIPGQAPTPQTSDLWSIRVLIEKIEKYMKAKKKWAAMHRRREGEVINRMEECVADGDIPHVFYGAAHTHEVLDRCADKRLAVLLTTPASLEYTADSTFFDDERHATHIFLEQTVLPSFRQWLTMKRPS